MASHSSQVCITRVEIAVDRNPPRSVRRKRTKKRAVAVRHLCPNSGGYGAICFTAFRASSALPTRITFNSTLLCIHRLPWLVDWSPRESNGSLLEMLAAAIGDYPSYSDCSLGLRLIGFANCKKDQTYRWKVEHGDDSTWDPDDFWLDTLSSDAIVSSRTSIVQRHPSAPTDPKQVAPCVPRELVREKVTANLARELTSRCADNPNSLCGAQTPAEVATARPWLAQSIQIGSVVTLLEVRHPLGFRLLLSRVRALRPAAYSRVVKELSCIHIRT